MPPVKPPPLSNPLAPVANRLTVVEIVYHQQGTNGPEELRHTYSRILTSDEQPFPRRNQTATQEWKSIDLAYIKDCGCGLLTIRNHEGEVPYRNLTDAEKAEAASRILEVCYKGQEKQPWLVHPKEDMRVCPSSCEGLIVRARVGTIKFSYCAYPS